MAKKRTRSKSRKVDPDDDDYCGCAGEPAINICLRAGFTYEGYDQKLGALYRRDDLGVVVQERALRYSIPEHTWGMDDTERSICSQPQGQIS